jgi:cytochrome c oxidase subunit 2
MPGGNYRSGGGKPRQPWKIVVPIIIAALMLSGCAGVSSVLSPRSHNTQQISNLIITLFSIAAVVFVIVEGLLIYATIRFSRKSLPGEASQTEGNRPLEIGWTLAPAIVLAFVFVFTLPTLRSIAYQPASYVSATTGQVAQPITVKAIGHQWWWEFDYPGLGIVTADVLHVPVGAVVNVDVESVDVIHSFWIPQIVQKIDAVPGHSNKIWFQANTIGVYDGQCAEFCGTEHADMRLKVVVESENDFNNWVALQTAPLPKLTGAAAQGEQVFLNGACVGCHTIDGTKAAGTVGPNLTHFGSREYFAGAILQNTPENVARWLENPQAVKPGNDMPNLHLSQEQITQLVAFLESLK